ncbi:hypothetical protein Cgig2_034112 [Carnegiea gigantea]|uniref:Uncharacterized protein n=1 Tax=Carnegiea gigantea TaxID=171969 RepID=A0A9Q1QBN9_9CARY|nr:hypothetical protein Cgig2_034112 [Carnegiea gigantea]
MADKEEMRSLALTPTWSVASVLTVFVAVSLLVERSIHRLSNWLHKTHRKPLLQAVKKMKEELMLLGFISLLLTATATTISNICIPSKFFDGAFAPCSRSDIDEAAENKISQGRKLWDEKPHTLRRLMNVLNENKCPEACASSSLYHSGEEPFVSYEGLEQLHRFIFIMAVTHVTYSCLTMLLALVKVRVFIHSWRAWEDQVQMDRHDVLTGKFPNDLNHQLY